MRILKMFPILSLLVFSMQILQAKEAGELITGVYNETLQYYDANGKKMGKFRNVTDKEIQGVRVKGTSPRNLKNIVFRSKDVWVRASQVKLSIKQSAVCPDAPPSTRADRTVPVSSGMGADCKKGGENK